MPSAEQLSLGVTIITISVLRAAFRSARRSRAAIVLVTTACLYAPAAAQTTLLTLPLPKKPSAAVSKVDIAPVEVRDLLQRPEAPSTPDAAASEGAQRRSKSSTPADAMLESSSDERVTRTSMTVVKGESLYSLFTKHGLSAGELMEILATDPAIKKRLARLQPGDTIILQLDQASAIQQLLIDSRRMNNALIVRDDGGYRLRATVDAEAASRSVMQPEVQATSTTSAKVRNVGTTAEIPAAEPDDVPPTIAKLVIENGQSLYELFQQEKLSRIDLIAMTKADATTRRKLDRVRPGQVIHVRHRNGDIDSLRLAASRGDKDFLISRSLDGFSSAQVAPLPREPAAVTIRADASEPTPSSSAQGLAPRTDVTADDDRETSTAGLAGMPAVLPAAVVEHELEVQPGESLYLIFKRLQVPPSDLGRVMSNKEALPLKRLRPGQVLSLRLLSDNRLLSLSSDINDTRNISIVRQPDESMRVTVKDTPLERRTADATGLIEDSLFLSGQRAGLSDRVIMQLVEIFGWDVDFALDVRAGDRFTVVYEELYKDGTKVRDGNILAGEFINGGRQLRGVRFTDASGNTSYYSPDGLSMRKAFLRTPVSFSRISSRFSLARKHPVLNKIRAHKGVDYAAPRGTPIKSSGNGRVTFSGWRRGYGRTVKIQHGGKYETLYAHMTRIHPRAKPGKRVSQGEVIGYVGSTGLATGPHLHYEFRVNGVHKDPLRVKLPKALPIEDRYLADFKATARPLIAQLDLLARTRLAATD